MSSLRFERVALVGLGLIGSSLCHAMRRAGIAEHIAGTARSEATRCTALRLGLTDSMHAAADDAVAGADLVVMCVPVGAMASVAETIAPVLRPGAILTEVGSVKGSVVRDVAPHVPEHVQFIPGHPIAGTEYSGPEAGFAELFDNRWCILTPQPDCEREAVDRLTRFWKACGSHVELMSVEHHDLVLGITSHLPHLIAYNIVSTAADLEEVTQSEVIKFSAGGFRDFTRIAASDPIMWRDVFLNNREAVLELLGRFTEDLAALQKAIRWGDGAALLDLFVRSRDIRRRIVEAGQDTAAPDFGRPHGP